ncbi:MAG: two-component system sensor histidine kinase ChvG [Granulosicoccus sp.]|jgi:two-component system sensor histidine kinase ChvG
MKLRSQMLLAGALTLAVPIVGLQSVKQLYSALQQTRIDEQTLKVANMRLALSDEESVNSALMTGLPSAGEKDWYAQSSPYPMFVDGYADDWQELNDRAFRFEIRGADSTDDTVDLLADVRVAKSSDYLFIYLTVIDDEVIYHLPPAMRPDAGEGELPNRQARLVNGDSIEVLAQDYRGYWKHTLFRPIAPGKLTGLRASGNNGGRGSFDTAELPIPGWVGAWVSVEKGYHIEIKLPLPPSGTSIGLAIIDVDYSGENRSSWAGTLSPKLMAEISSDNAILDPMPGGFIFHDSPSIHQYLKRWTSPGVRARLFDVHGRLMADIDNLYEKYDLSDEAFASAETSDGLWDAILLRIFAFFVAGDLPLLPESRSIPVSLILSDERRAMVVGDNPITSRYVTDENDRVLGTLAPIGSKPRRGYVLFEANEEHASAYAGSEMARLYSLLLLVSLLAGSGLLIFAFVLSSRIRRLSQEAQHAVADDGRVYGLPGSDAQDEIGDLSRKLSTLLARSAAYTQYLEALASRLSHELRTPLSVVRTSLENLDREQLDAQSLQLIDRASDGADHLGSIIKALVESTRLEQSVQLADKQPINLVEWISGSLQRYRQIYPETDLHLNLVSASTVNITASPELLQQAFDKLVDNAVGFAKKGPVVLHLATDKQILPYGASLGVSNLGEEVPADAMVQWFNPMFSDRQVDGRELHLGLGLYIVKMIAESHGGSVFARNQRTADHQQWIHVGLRLPMS